jgi:type IV fimbrial biogenesis protein FimT
MVTCEFSSPHNRKFNQGGFTLIEVMVAISVLAVLMAIAIPGLREFVVRNRMASLSNEFSANMSEARNEAISRNQCVTMCQSDNTDNALTGGAVSCATTGSSNWMRGTFIFLNPTCSATINKPLVGGEVFRVIQPPGGDYELISGGGVAPTRFMFDGRGLLSLNSSANLTLTASNPDDDLIMKNRRQLCISAAGRVTIRKYEAGPCN